LKHLRAVNKYFWKYRWRLLLGLLFIILSNYSASHPAGDGLCRQLRESELRNTTSPAPTSPHKDTHYDILVRKSSAFWIGPPCPLAPEGRHLRGHSPGAGVDQRRLPLPYATDDKQEA